MALLGAINAKWKIIRMLIMKENIVKLTDIYFHRMNMIFYRIIERRRHDTV